MCGRRAVGAGAQQQTRVASCWEPMEEAEHRLVVLWRVCRRRAFKKNLEIVAQFHHEIRRGRYNFSVQLNELSDTVSTAVT